MTDKYPYCGAALSVDYVSLLRQWATVAPMGGECAIALRQAADEIERLRALVQCCERDHNYDGDCDRHPNGLRGEIERLRAELADRDEWHQAVMSETCPSDERHCACVPVLRRELAERTRERDEALKELRAWNNCRAAARGILYGKWL